MPFEASSPAARAIALVGDYYAAINPGDRETMLACLAEEPICNDVPREKKHGHTVTKG